MLKRENILDLLSQLIQIPSVNPHFEQGYNEMEIARFICNWLRQHKIQAHIDEVQPNRPNVVTEIGNGEGPTLCLCAHLDTVGVQEMSIPPFEPTVVDNRVYGRGSCDMKGGLAAVLSAAVALSQTEVRGKILLALVCDEEYSSIGADDFVRRYRADACILTEPSDLKLVTAHKGFLWGKITLLGKSAHGSRWDVGKSAITEMGKVLVALDTFDKEVLRNRADDLVGPASMHVGLITGGGGISTYAASCEIHIERRTLPAETREHMEKELEEIIHKIAPQAQIEWYFYRPPFGCQPQETIVSCVKQAYRDVMEKEPEIVGWGVWTDAAIFQQANIPTVNIGPSGFGLHEPVEWVDIDTVKKNAEILFKAATLFFESGVLCQQT